MVCSMYPEKNKKNKMGTHCHYGLLAGASILLSCINRSAWRSYRCFRDVGTLGNVQGHCNNVLEHCREGFWAQEQEKFDHLACATDQCILFAFCMCITYLPLHAEPLPFLMTTLIVHPILAISVMAIASTIDQLVCAPHGCHNFHDNCYAY